MRSASHDGFTLIELMVTLVILAILVVLGFPSYEQWIRNTAIRNAAESIQNGLRLARNEATQRSTNVRFELTSSAGTADWTVCQLPTGVTNCSGTGVTTIQSFASNGGANGVLITASTAIAQTTNTGATISGGLPGGITFNALGRPSDYGNTSLLRIDASNLKAGSRRLVTTISPGGMVRMCDPKLPFSTTTPQGCQ